MASWSDLATAVGIATLGAAATDAVLFRTEKVAVHKRLSLVLKRLDRRSIPDIPVAMAGRLLAWFERAFGRRLNLRSFAIAASTSVVLTTGAGMLGVWVQRVGGQNYALYAPEVYLINFLFDAATLAATVVALRRITSSGGLMAIGWAISSVLLALTFAVGTAVATESYAQMAQRLDLPHYRQHWAYRESVARNALITALSDAESGNTPEGDSVIAIEAWRPVVAEQVYWFLESTSYWIGADGCCHSVELFGTRTVDGVQSRWSIRTRTTPMVLEGILFSATTLIPTALLALMIALAVWAKAILRLARTISLRVLKAITDVDPKEDPRQFMPATLFVVLSGSLVCVLKLFWEIRTVLLRILFT